jgi:hypothetical protein
VDECEPLLTGHTRASQRELAAALHIASAPPPSPFSPDANGSSTGPLRNPNTASVCEAQFLKARVEALENNHGAAIDLLVAAVRRCREPLSNPR